MDISDYDISAESSQPSADLQSIPCKNHPKQLCCTYCVNCGELICPTCLTSIHMGHEIEEIETVYKEKLAYLRKHVSDKVDPKDLAAIFGFMSDLTISEAAREIKLKIKDTFTTTFPFVDCISVTNHNTTWISCCNNALHEIRFQPNMSFIHKYEDKRISDMAATLQGELLLTILSDTNLYRLNYSGLMTSLHDFNPLIPKAVCVSNAGIIVSTKEGGEPWPVTSSSQRQCVFLDLSGKKKIKVVEYDSNKKRLFTLICKITAHNKYEILAVDLLSKQHGRIVALNNSSIMWMYEGNEEVNTEDNHFHPTDVVTTPAGNIIVTDIDSHALHFLSDDGVLIKYIITKDLNIIFPLSLEIDSAGRLWIGCNRYKNDPYNAKLHVAEYTGC